VAGKQAAAAVCVALALGLRRPLQWRCCCPRSLALVVRRQPRRRQAQPVVVAALGGGAQGQGWRRVASCQRRRVCLCYCAVFGSAMVSACSARGQLPPAPLASAPTTTRLPRHGAENAATHAPPSEASCACDAAPRPRCVSSPRRCHHSWAAVRTSAAATPRTVKFRAAKSAFKSPPAGVSVASATARPRWHGSTAAVTWPTMDVVVALPLAKRTWAAVSARSEGP
jgi:hypothetical protein